MFERFYPKEYVKSTYDIDFAKYYEMGYRGIIFDIDNTLVEHGADANEKALDFFAKLKEIGYNVCLVSNNGKTRVERFNKDIQVNFIHKANKPFMKSYYRAMKLNKSKPSNTIFVGDQLFTDIYGANRCGIYSILVHPISKKEEIQIVLKRYLERPVLRAYKRKRK